MFLSLATNRKINDTAIKEPFLALSPAHPDHPLGLTLGFIIPKTTGMYILDYKEKEHIAKTENKQG